MELITAILFLAALSAVLATVLAVAHQVFWVYEDPRIDVVSDLLPGANCGACGLPGCRVFAENVITGDITPAQCSVGGPATAESVAGFLGIEAGKAEKKVARLLCAGGADVAIHVGEYEGFSSCRAAAVISGGTKGCAYGCIGLADCERACTFGAISMAPNRLPVVDAEKCTSCNDCVVACPKYLFVLQPLSHKLVVQCKSILSGDTALDLCKVACTGCGICASDAPEGLIRMEYNLPVIQKDHIHLETDIATVRCPTGAIQWIDGQQFKEQLVAEPSVDRIRNALLVQKG